MSDRSRVTIRNYSILFAVATLLSIVYAGDNVLVSGQTGTLALKRFFVVLLGWYCWVALLPLIQRLVKGKPLTLDNWWKLLGLHIPIAFVTGCFLFWIQTSLAHSIGLFGKLDDLQIISWKIVNYFQILVLLYGIEFYRARKEQEIRACQLRARIDELQLQSLKTHLRPAFLFETLDCLDGVMKKDADLADDLIAMLGDFLRNTLTTALSNSVTLRQELDLIHSYLRIESALRQEKLNFRIEMDPGLSDAILPGLLLQPLVEKSIHNKPSSGIVDLLIRSTKNSERLRITIREGEITTAEEQPEQSEWILRTRDHLRELYGPNQLLEVAAAPAMGFQAEVELPLQYADPDDEATFDSEEIKGAADSLKEDDLESYARLIEKQPPPKQPESSKPKKIAKQYAITFAIWTVLIGYFVVRIGLSAARMNDPVSNLDLGFMIYSWYVCAALTPLVLWFAIRWPITRHNLVRSIATHFAASIAFWLLMVAVYVLPMPLFYKGTYTLFLSNALRSYGFAIDLLVYWTIIGVAYAIESHKEQQRQALRSSALELEFVRAQLQALHMQLHPHFLFNTLHLISELVHEDIDQARKMLERLKEFLKLTIENSGSHQIALDKELQFLKHYLQIQQIRFQNRLNVRLNVEDAALPLLVPNLILQPIVENAIRHGIARKREAGLLEIDINRNNGSLRMRVKDDGPGFTGKKLKEGLGLSNTRIRLQRLYGAAHQFEFQNPAEGGLIVSLTIPVMEKQ